MDNKHFPAIVVTSSKSRVEGLLGLSLNSVLHADLLADAFDSYYKKEAIKNGLEFDIYHQNRKTFLHAVCDVLDNITLEIHLSCLPNVTMRARGIVFFSLFLRATGTTEKKVKETLIDRYLSIAPLLAAYFPEMEFSSIRQASSLQHRYLPFPPKDAVAISRRHVFVSLSAPLKRNTIGFGMLQPDSGESKDTVSHCFPWIPSHEESSQLVKTALGHLDPVQIIVRLRSAGQDAKEAAAERLSDTNMNCEYFMAGLNRQRLTLVQQAHLIRTVSVRQQAFLEGPCFRAGIFILSPSRVDSSVTNIVGRCITRSTGSSGPDDLFQGGFSHSRVSVAKALKLDGYSEKEPICISEAAGSVLLPYPPKENVPGLPIKRSRTALAIFPDDFGSSEEKVLLFHNADKGHIQPVNIGANDRMRHMFVVGQTGTGKSTFMENTILQDIVAGRGVAVIDPHGDMVDKIIGKIPEAREKDVIIFDLLDRKYPVGFNIIAWRTLDERDLIIDELYQSLDHLYNMKTVGGPVFETHFRNMMKLLMGDKKRKSFVPTLLDFTRCYLDRDFRSWLKKNIGDKQTVETVDEFEKTDGDWKMSNMSQYITSKLSRFNTDTGLKRILGQESTGFDFDEIINDSKIFLVKLGRGRFGPTVSGLIANQLVARFKMAAMKRGGIPPEQRRDFFLYVDECHTLPTENFMDLLSEARKFRMALILATQYTAQLKKSQNGENNFLSAVLGNVGSIIMFRLGQEDATGIAQVLSPYFSSQDIIGLANWHGYSRMQSDYGTVLPFSFYTEKDPYPFDSAAADRIIAKNRKKYGRPAKKIDTSLNKRSINSFF